MFFSTAFAIITAHKGKQEDFSTIYLRFSVKAIQREVLRQDAVRPVRPPGKEYHRIMDADRQTEPGFPAQLLPSVAVQLRHAMGNLHFAANALAPAEIRENDPELDRFASALDQSYYQLLRLANNLTFAHSLSSGAPLSTRDLELPGLIRSICGQCRPYAALQGVSLTFRCPQKKHLCAVAEDAMEMLLYQLLSNALKFTPQGGSITVDLRFANRMVLLSVSDTGCGVSPELLPTLFDRYRHEGLMSPQPHGLGLGLPLCRRIAEGHGGNLVAEAREGRGLTVTLSIPDRRCGTSAVEDFPFDYAGGFDRTLLGLADALPASAFSCKRTC